MPRVNPLTQDERIRANIKKITRQRKHELDDAGITLTKVASVLNISPQAVSAQFKGKCNMSVEVYVATEMLLRGEIQ